MKIYKFSQLGKRGNNEDSLGITEGLITVCDGMGGHNFGERASAFVVEHMMKAFEHRAKIGKMEIQQQLNKVHDDLNHLLDSEPELEKMGTTFTGVFITPDVWYAAHIGDSRIYLFRPSEKKLWHTWDHSLVGELMRTHEITIEAGRFHPLSNRISKALIAQKDSPQVNASIVKLDNLQKGDILLLCSDGVIESWGDHEFVQLMADTSLTFEQKCEKISKQCDANSKDNNTAIIVEIEDQDAFNYGNDDELDWTSFEAVNADYQQYLKDNSDEGPAEVTKVNPKSAAQPRPKAPQKPQPKAQPKAQPKPQPKPKQKNGSKMIYIILAVLVVIGLGVFWVFNGNKTEVKEEENNVEVNGNEQKKQEPAQTKDLSESDDEDNVEVTQEKSDSEVAIEQILNGGKENKEDKDESTENPNETPAGDPQQQNTTEK